MKNNFKESFEYLMSLSNKELRKEIENSNWNFILQELRYAGDEIERLNNIINELEKWCNDVMKVLYSFKELDVWDNAELKTLKQVLNKLKELKGSDSNEL